MLTAINSVYQHLDRALTQPPPSARELFDVPQDRSSIEPSVETTIRMTDAQHAAVDALVDRHSTTRSALFAAAANLYLHGPR